MEFFQSYESALIGRLCLVSVISYIRDNNCYGYTGYGRATEAKKGGQWFSMSDEKNYSNK